MSDFNRRLDGDWYPHVVIRCDHRTGGDPAQIARYKWTPVEGVWVPTERSRVRVEYMEGNRRGWWNRDRRDDERSRVHHEVYCEQRTPQCRVPALRVDRDDLMELFATITGNRKWRNEVTVSVDSREVVVLLADLATARRAARRRIVRRLFEHP